MRFRPAIFFFALLLSLTGVLHSFAQKAFREGTLIYTVTLDPPDNQEGLIQYTGTYTITIKDKLVRKDLSMDNGYSNMMLFDEKEQTVYALKEMQGKKYAIQLDMANMEQRRSHFQKFTLKEKEATADMAGLPARKGIVIYKDGTKKELLFSKDWTPEVLLFDQLPGIKVLPLAFQSKGDDGLTMHFLIQKVIAEPVETSIFKIPQDYKVMSSQEYRELSR
jgi:hypothetical protein